MQSEMRQLRTEMRSQMRQIQSQISWMLDCMVATSGYGRPPPRFDHEASTSGVRRRDDDDDGDGSAARRRGDDHRDVGDAAV